VAGPGSGTAGQSWGAAGAAAALAVLLLLPGLGASPFDDPGEGQHAEIAREVSTGDGWLTLRLNGVRYFDKPPLLYWLTAAAFSRFGPSEWAGRLPPLAGAALACAATAFLGTRLLGPAGGVIAAGALLSSALFVAFGRYLRPETLFVAAIQWGFAGLLLTDEAASGRRVAWRWPLVGCAALGVAALVKDPVGLIGPLAAVGVARALAGRLRPLRAWLPWTGVGALLVVGFGWYAVEAARNAGFLWYSVVDNHVLNALRLRRFPDEDVPLSTLEFLAVSALGAFPWIIPAALATVSLARRRAWRSACEMPWTALGLWALGLAVCFAIVPFKLPHYALPAYPAVALLAARGWAERSGRARPLIAVHALLFGLLAVGFLLVARSDGKLFTNAVFSATDVYTRKEAVLGEAGPRPSWLALEPLVAWAGVVFASTSVALVWALRRGSSRLGSAMILVGMLAVMPTVEAGVALVASTRAVAAMGAAVRREIRPGDLLVHEGPIENSGALELYSGRRPLLLDARRSVLGIGATFPDAQDTFWDRARLRREWLSGARRVLLVTPRPPAQSVVIALPPAHVRLLFRLGGRSLYDNARP
jgi:4-amino-4-deoxy-L-arabinose transferase-like glycosyltransferase